MSIDKAMENGIHCAGCTFVTLQIKPSYMYCPWCMGEAKARIAELEAMVRELVGQCVCCNDNDTRCSACTKALALLNQEERNP